MAERKIDDEDEEIKNRLNAIIMGTIKQFEKTHGKITFGDVASVSFTKRLTGNIQSYILALLNDNTNSKADISMLESKARREGNNYYD